MAVPYTPFNQDGFYQAADFTQKNRLQDIYLQRDTQDRALKMQDRQAAMDRQKAKDDQDAADRERQRILEHIPFAQAALESGNPNQFIASALADPRASAFLKQGGIFDQEDVNDPELTDQLKSFIGLAGPAAAPKQPQIGGVQPGDWTPESLAKFQQTGDYSVLQRYAPAPKPEKPQAAFRTLTPEEVQAAGLPAGTSAQLDLTTNKVDVLSKREVTGGLSQKDMTTAKQKLNTVKIARQQLANIKAKFADIQNSMSAGPGGQGRLPTPKGRAFDAAVNQMRSTLTALTRVPGVGAMSDYETKLDQAKFPTRNDYENVTADQINGIEQLLDGIESGYSDLMGGGNQSPQSPQAPASGGWSIKRVK